MLDAILKLAGGHSCRFEHLKVYLRDFPVPWCMSDDERQSRNDFCNFPASGTSSAGVGFIGCEPTGRRDRRRNIDAFRLSLLSVEVWCDYETSCAAG